MNRRRSAPTFARGVCRSRAFALPVAAATLAIAACSSAPSSTEGLARTIDALGSDAGSAIAPSGASLVGPRAAPLPTPAAIVGTSNGCSVSRSPGLPTSVASTLGTDLVAKYLCPGCQSPAVGAGPNDFASQGAIQNAESNPVVELLFWGDVWSDPNTSPSMFEVDQALRTVVASTYFDGLKQYGVQSIRIDRTDIASGGPKLSPSTYGTSDVADRIFNLIDNTSMYSDRTDNTIFLVVMPPDTTPAKGCGAHGIHTDYNWPQINTANVAWAAFTDLDSITSNATHELVEAITNPHGSAGGGLDAWTMNRGFLGGPTENEIADACDGQQDYINGVLVSDYWSNTDRACIIPFPVATVTGMEPTTGTVGSPVTITGTNLGLPLVTFGSSAATSVACPSTTQCTAIVPPGVGREAVTVGSDYGSASAGTFCIPVTPATCPSVGANCGTMSDQCGGTVNCGSCGAGQQCGDFANANWCVAACVPGDCTGKCGDTTDGCGAPLSCGGCASGQSCVSGVCEGVSSPTCPIGYTWNGRSCVRTGNSCDPCSGKWPHCFCM